MLDQLFPSDPYKDAAPIFQKNVNLPHCKNPELFCIWLMYHLTLLYGYSENGGYHHSPSSRVSIFTFQLSSAL